MTAQMSDATTLMITLVTCVAAFSVLWAISLRKNDASIVDWYWGTGFGVIALTYALLHGGSASAWVLTLLTVIWSLRLTGYMVRRHLWKGEEDARYAAMREAGGPTFKRDSLFKIFWLQAVIMWMVATPQHVGLLYGDGVDRPLAYFAGLFLFALGLTLETIADAQLDQFIRTPGNRGRLMTSGLFAMVRHPNYTGEIILWWGLGLLGYALSGLFWSFLGPAILTFLLVKVSGVPMLDAHLSTRAGWAEYAARTPALFPFRSTRPARSQPSGDAIT